MLVTSTYAATLVPLLPPTLSPSHLPPPAHLSEFCPTSAHSGEASAFVEGVSRAPIRVYFVRHEGEKRVGGTEAVAGLASVDGQEAWVKVYATGEGVQGGPHSWFLDTAFGDLAIGTNDVEKKKVTLRLCACELKAGVQLGTGHLLLSDVAYIEEKDPIAVFTWYYASRAHLDFFGVLPGPSPPLSLSSTDSALSFLRQSNQILISLLTAEQRLAFLDEMSIDIGTLALLPEIVQGELQRFRQEGRAAAPVVAAAAGGEGEQDEMQDDSGMWEGGIEGLLLDQSGEGKEGEKSQGESERRVRFSYAVTVSETGTGVVKEAHQEQ